MFDYRLDFVHPWYLLLLLLLPVLWAYSFPRLAVLGPVRRWVALVLRTLVVLLFVAAIAGVQTVRISDKVTVIYLVDQSLSIPEAERDAMVKYVNASVERHRQGRDRAGVIVFGRDAAIEIPPFDDKIEIPGRIESEFNAEHTNLAAAMKLAQGSFPEDAAKRVFVISDGNQTLGNVMEQADELRAAGIGIDVLPVHYAARAEVVVERLVLPGDIRRGEPFDLKAVVTNTAPEGTPPVRGRLVFARLAGDRREVLNPEPEQQEVVLAPGKTVKMISQQIDTPDFYTYEVRFIPARPDDDAMPQNNRSTAFTHVRGKGQVLLIVDYEHPDEFVPLVEQLNQQNLEVAVLASNELFTRQAELLVYDTVVLANVPRSTDENVSFTDDQIQMLVNNTHELGAGLVMLGGPNSFGAGGWSGTELEKAMPVDFRIKSAKVVPRGALVMIMHACEIAEGNNIQKQVAHEAIRILGDQDYCGVIQWMGTDQWLWRGGLAEVGPNRQQMMGAVNRMTPSDMPAFDPSMQMAFTGFQKVPQASIKHMIIISDGDPSFAQEAKLVNQLVNPPLGVTISTVAVGSHGPANSALLARIARRGGGKYYAVNQPKALPRIYQKEVRRVARPLVYENPAGFPALKDFPHEILGGIDTLPPLTGYVLTTKKENPLVEVSLLSSEPAGRAPAENRTLLASWTFGLGKAVAFTSDAGALWTKQWPGKPEFGRLFGQIVRWSMRPTGDSGKFSVATEADGEQVRVIVTALDKNEEFINFLSMRGHALGPDLQPVPIEIKQTAPGRYVGTFSSKDAGSYYLAIDPGAEDVGEDGTVRKLPPLLTGVNVPYSDEFRSRASNDELLKQLAAVVPEGGEKGTLIDDRPPSSDDEEDPRLKLNPFRHEGLRKARSSQDAWYYAVLLASCVFFADVFIRRVQVNFNWLGALWARAAAFVMRRERAVEVEILDRLRSRKEEVGKEIDRLRAEARFDVPPEPPRGAAGLEEPELAPPPEKKPPAPKIEAEAEEESYTQRLLKAKKKAWKDKDEE
jgi:uncharacterized membrane protein/Mg-chelatase subunit ChlD